MDSFTAIIRDPFDPERDVKVEVTYTMWDFGVMMRGDPAGIRPALLHVTDIEFTGFDLLPTIMEFDEGTARKLEEEAAVHARDQADDAKAQARVSMEGVI